MAWVTYDFAAVIRTFTNRNYAIFTIGNTISLIGTWMQRLAVGWLMWELTESGTWLGALAMAEFVPTIFVMPLSGVLADRLDRVWLSVLGQALACLQAIILWVLLLVNTVTPEILLSLSLYLGIVSPFTQTARLTIVPAMVPKAILVPAIAINSVIFNVARVIGPAVAGIIISFYGIVTTIAINAISFSAVIIALLALRLEIPRTSNNSQRNIVTDLAEGWRYTYIHPVLGKLMSLLLVCTLFTWPLNSMLPGIVATAFDGEPKTLAIYTSCIGTGAIVAGLWLAQRGNSGLATLVSIAVVVNGLSVALFSGLNTFWMGAAVLLIIGFVGAVVGTGSQTVVQSMVEESLRGRAVSVWYVTMTAGPAIGALILGWLTETFGFGALFITGGLVTALAAAWNLGKT